MRQPNKKSASRGLLKKIQSGNKLLKPEMNSKERTGASSLEKLFMAQLKHIYDVEQRLMELLPRVKQGCTTEELENAFELHTIQTEIQAKRLEKIFSMLKPEVTLDPAFIINR